MMKKGLILIIFLLISFFLCSSVEASTLRVQDLIANADKYNGTEVTITGEVILEPIERSDGVFLNVNDNGSVIGVFIDKKLYSNLHFTYFGDYKHIGDKIQVTGIFHFAWDKKNGELAIEAKDVKVISVGHPVDVSPSKPLIIWSLISVLFLIVVYLVYLKVFKVSNPS